MGDIHEIRNGTLMGITLEQKELEWKEWKQIRLRSFSH